jgi:type I restriction enzyme S subunit
LLKATIPLPPIDEQRRIVERIDELAGKADSLERLGRTVAEAKEELFSRIVSEVSDRLIQSHGSESLEVLTSFIGDMNHEMPTAVVDGVPFISPKDFGPDWTIDFGGAKRISPDDFARHAIKCKPQRDDILMARYGTIGAARSVDTDMEFLASYSIAVIRPDSQRVLPRFLFWMVTSRHIQEQAIQGIRGSGMADLGLKTIRLFMIPVVGLDEQAVIVKRLDVLRDQTARLCKHSTAALVEIRSFIPSVLNAAFSGQL